MDDLNSSICRIFCTAENGAELHPFRLRIRRSQVRVLPSALRKFLVLQVKRGAKRRAEITPDPFYTNPYTNTLTQGTLHHADRPVLHCRPKRRNNSAGIRRKSANVRTAGRYARHGMPVFPCRLRGKEPLHDRRGADLALVDPLSGGQHRHPHRPGIWPSDARGCYELS